MNLILYETFLISICDNPDDIKRRLEANISAPKFGIISSFNKGMTPFTGFFNGYAFKIWNVYSSRRMITPIIYGQIETGQIKVIMFLHPFFSTVMMGVFLFLWLFLHKLGDVILINWIFLMILLSIVWKYQRGANKAKAELRTIIQGEGEDFGKK